MNHNYEIIQTKTLDCLLLLKSKRIRIMMRLMVKYNNRCVRCNCEGVKFMLGRAQDNGLHWDIYTSDDIMLTIDHIHPKYHGGKNSQENYQLMCKICNEAKGSTIE